jgi:filamentous hemagglutinin family protein
MKKHILPLLTTALSILPAIAQAQTYTPSNRAPQADNSIGTVVNPTGVNNFNITGGLQRGQNLLHSFTDFSIPTGGSVNFTNPGNQSIITRVTGSFFSDLNGTLSTNGANFLLINPNGVVFGPGIKLNVGKAFVTSTANGIDFVDAQGRNYNFGTNRAGDVPLLSIAPNVAFNPTRLIIGASAPGSKGIENYGALSSNNPAQYIGLIGGDVTFNGGQIYNQGGKVELGGLRQSGAIEFSFDNGVKLPTNVERANVSLLSSATATSEIYVQSGGGGSVNIFAKDITFKGSDTGIKAGIDGGLGSATAKAGDVKLDATGNVALSDGAVIFNLVNSGGVGKGGGIEIVTGGNLSASNGARIAANTIGKGDAGSVKITATGNVTFDGRKDGFNSGVLNSVEKGAEGKAGGIEIVAANLTVKNGAQLTASTFGTGNAGNIKITATGGTVSFDGGIGNGRSGVLSRVEAGAVGNAGGIEISAANLSITNGAGLTTSTEGTGNAGDIKITASGTVSLDGGVDAYRSTLISTVEKGAVGKGGTIEIVTRNLSVTNGAGLAASTAGKGDAGKVKITATENISFDGVVGIYNTGVLSGVAAGAEGNAGGIEISAAKNLSITNGAILTAGAEGTGTAGDISLKGNTITLNKSGIFSKSSSANGGNINIITTDYLLLRNTSRIATDSDLTGRNGNGGNITINSPLIIAAPGNNDITANAYAGNGGKVNINSQGLFGIQYRPTGTNFTNDITASSTFGQNGAVNISTPGTDPGKDSTELPKVTTDASNQISQVCSANNRQNKLTVAGRGGLPPTANDPLTSDVIWQDARAASRQPAISSATTNPVELAPPAVGWVFNGNKVTLVAAKTNGEPTGTNVTCPNIK